MTQKPFDVREEVPVKQPSVLIASDSFKGSVSSSEVADLIERGVLRVCSDSSVRKFAIADGGEGTVEAVVSALGGTLRGIEVSGPLGDPVRAHYGLVGRDLAVIEVAVSSGITLIEQTSGNARNASSLGLGQMILDAIDQGARKIYIGLGGPPRATAAWAWPRRSVSASSTRRGRTSPAASPAWRRSRPSTARF